MQAAENARYAVVIPARGPSAALVDSVRDLAARGIPAVVVDDGSGSGFESIFDAIAPFPNVRLVRHAVPLGRGAALKTGINRALCEFPELRGVIAADAEQQSPEEIERVAACWTERPDTLVVGVRDAGRAASLRHRVGDAIARRVLRVVTGAKLHGEETALRGVPASMFAHLLRADSNGCEFEFEMLTAARQLGIRVVEEDLGPGCEAGGFNPLADSLQTPFVLARFTPISLITALLDNLAFFLVWKSSGFILQSLVVGRLAAVVFNYPMARRAAFRSRAAHEVLLPRYLLLLFASGAASYLGIRFLTGRFGVHVMPAKLFVETLLFFGNFLVERSLVFREGRPGAGRGYTRLILVVLAVLAAVELYGLRASQIFAQEIWSPQGIAHVSWFGALYAGVSTALLILVPWLFAPLATAVLALLTTIFLGPAAALGAACYLLSAWALGQLLARNRLPHLLATLLGAAVYIFFLPFAARLPVNYPLAYAVALALPVLANFPAVLRELPAILRAPLRWELRTWGERLCFAALLLIVISHWFAMLKPEASADGLSMHLAIPVNIAANHAMTFDPGHYVWAVMPMGADLTYSAVYLLGGEMAARFLNFTFLLVLLGMVYGTLRRWLSPALSWLLVALFAATPLVQLATGSLFVENLLAAIVFGAMISIWLYAENGQRHFLFTAGVLGGTALAVKLGAIAFLAPALVCAAVEVRRHRGKARAAWLIASLLFLGAAAPPYVIAWWKTGNPVFPFLNGKFQSRLLDPKADIQDKRFRRPLTWGVPYDLTFRSNRYYEGQNGTFGFQYLVLAPLALLALLVAPRRQAVTAAAVACVGIVMVFRSEPNARYLYPALPLLMVPFGALLAWALARQRLLARALIGFAIACTALDAWFLPGSSYYHKDFYGPFTRAQRAAYLGETAPIRKSIEWLNAHHPKAGVLLTQDSYIAGLGSDVYENHWHQYNTMDRIRRTAGMESLRALLGAWKVEYLLARKPSARDYLSPAALKNVLDNCTVPEYEFKYYYVARLEPECKALPPAAPVQPVLTAARGTYDDIDPFVLFRGDWERGDRFDGAFAQTLAYTDTAGAEVVFAFEGTAVTFVFTRAPNRGYVAAEIDGVPKGRFDLYSSAVEWQRRLTFDGLPAGRHVLLLRVTGEKRPGAEGAFVDLDALEVR
jgi:hypothetical protein